MFPGTDRRWLLVCVDGRPSDLLARLGRGSDRPHVVEVGPDGNDGPRAARRLGRRRFRGVLLAVPAASLAGGGMAETLLARLSPLPDRLRARHGRLPAVLLLTHDALPAGAGPLGGFGRHPAEVLGEMLRQASCRSLAAIAASGEAAGGQRTADIDPEDIDPENMGPDGTGPAALPGRLAGAAAALAEGIEAVLAAADLDFAGAFLVPSATIPHEGGHRLPPALPARGPGRAGRRIAYPVAAALLATLAAVTAGGLSWSWARGLEERVATLGAGLAPASVPDAPPSPVALAALGGMAALSEDGAMSFPLLPASWSGTAERAMRRQVEARIGGVLVSPVRRGLERELAGIEAGLAALSSFPGRAGTMPQLAELLDRLLLLAGQGRRYGLRDGGDVRAQWEALAAGPGIGSGGGGPVALAWLDMPAARAGLGRAVAAEPWTDDRARRLADLAAGMIGAGLREASRAEDGIAALDDARAQAEAALLALSGAGAAETGRAAADLASALSLVARRAEAVAATAGTAQAEFDALEARLRPALDQAGLVPAALWGEIRHDAHLAGEERDAALAALSLPSFGPLFQAGRGVAQEETTPAPAFARNAAALEALAPLIEDRPFARPDFAGLTAGAGAPDPVPLARAAERFRQRRSWLDEQAPALPAELRNRLLPLLDRRSAEAGLADLAAAYRPAGGAGDRPAEAGGLVLTATSLDAVLGGLAETGGRDMLGDAAWLVGVRTYRLLEAVDRRYERENAFRVEPAIREWTGDGPILRGEAFRDMRAAEALMEEGTRRLREAAALAAPLIRTLDNDAVRMALPDPVLAGKWRALIRATGQAGGQGNGRESEGLASLRHYVARVLPSFGIEDCGDPAMLPPTAGASRDDPFALDLAAIGTALGESCGALVTAGMPLPGRKPTAPGPAPAGIEGGGAIRWQESW